MRHAPRILIVIAAVAALAWLLLAKTSTPPLASQPRPASVARVVDFPRIASATPTAPEAFCRIVATPEGFAPLIELPTADPLNRWKNPAKIVSPVFPKQFAGAVRVKSGTADVSATPLDAKSGSAGEIADDGSLIYKNAFDGCDVQYRCSAYKTEEFIVVKTSSSQTSWSWNLDTHGLTPRLTPANTIELCDAQKIPHLRINSPIGHDAGGKLLRVGERLTLELDGARLTLSADLKVANGRSLLIQRGAARET